LFTHWIADSLTLWKSPVTDEHLWTAASYYSILAKGPSQILYFLAAVVTLGGTTILWSLNDLQAENIMFDGGSICKPAHIPAFSPVTYYIVFFFLSPLWHDHCNVLILSTSQYVNHVIRSLYLHPDRFAGLFAKFSSLPTHQLKDPFPRALRNPTLELASSNLICSVALTGVLALQAGRLWAERADDDDDDDNVVVEAEEVAKVTKPRGKTPDIREDVVKPLLQQRVQTS